MQTHDSAMNAMGTAMRGHEKGNLDGGCTLMGMGVHGLLRTFTGFPGPECPGDAMKTAHGSSLRPPIALP